jgi:uncharacterized paraquat-inducible protein A
MLTIVDAVFYEFRRTLQNLIRSQKKENIKEKNPCLNCAGRNHNKNNPICRDCDKRIEYVNHLELKLNFTFSNGESLPTATVAPLSVLGRWASLDL